MVRWVKQGLDWNCESNKDVGIFLFGGVKTKVIDKVQYDNLGTAITYKSGLKKGAPKTKRVTVEVAVSSYIDSFSVTPYGTSASRCARTATGQYSVNDESLKTWETSSGGWISLLLENRKIKKQLTTYYTGMLDRVDDCGLIHPEYNHTITATGRLSSSDPNMQNVQN